VDSTLDKQSPNKALQRTGYRPSLSLSIYQLGIYFIYNNNISVLIVKIGYCQVFYTRSFKGLILNVFYDFFDKLSIADFGVGEKYVLKT